MRYSGPSEVYMNADLIKAQIAAGNVVRYDPLRSRILILTPQLSERHKFSDSLVKILGTTEGCIGIYPNIEKLLQEILK